MSDQLSGTEPQLEPHHHAKDREFHSNRPIAGVCNQALLIWPIRRLQLRGQSVRLILNDPDAGQLTTLPSMPQLYEVQNSCTKLEQSYQDLLTIQALQGLHRNYPSRCFPGPYTVLPLPLVRLLLSAKNTSPGCRATSAILSQRGLQEMQQTSP